MKEIQVCSNKGPGPLLRGDNYKNVKMGWGHLKIFFSRTTGPVAFYYLIYFSRQNSHSSKSLHNLLKISILWSVF
jgi:hypothetical protein